MKGFDNLFDLERFELNTNINKGVDDRLSKQVDAMVKVVDNVVRQKIETIGKVLPPQHKVAIDIIHDYDCMDMQEKEILEMQERLKAFGYELSLIQQEPLFNEEREDTEDGGVIFRQTLNVNNIRVALKEVLVEI
ncbi:hypothetical protein vBBceHLY2_00157 [Bacillus phage vB_BceH_LY2]|nr:hypothetical protein vBBceHLY2_00157 [Bacillus phage vB_BceH_LY2]